MSAVLRCAALLAALVAAGGAAAKDPPRTPKLWGGVSGGLGHMTSGLAAGDEYYQFGAEAGYFVRRNVSLGVRATVAELAAGYKDGGARPVAWARDTIRYQLVLRAAVPRGARVFVASGVGYLQYDDTSPDAPVGHATGSLVTLGLSYEPAAFPYAWPYVEAEAASIDGHSLTAIQAGVLFKLGGRRARP